MSFYAQLANPLVPADYTLVAEIEVIHDIQPLTDEQFALLDAYSPWNREEGNEYTWGDYDSSQFVNGTTIAKPETPRLLLVDIEPHLALL